MQAIQHIFFDLDHTLWDFDRNSAETLAEIYHEMELHAEIGDLNQFIETYKQINANYWHRYNHGQVTKIELRSGRFTDTLATFSVSNIKEKAERLGQTYLQRSPHKTHLFPGAHQTLAYLKKKYKLHIITNGFVEVQYLKLNNCNLATYFDLILCTEEVGVNKPHPLVFETALSKTKANPAQSVMIGDNLETDIKGAQNCGLHTVFFNPYRQINTANSAEIQELSDLLTLF